MRPRSTLLPLILVTAVATPAFASPHADARCGLIADPNRSIHGAASGSDTGDGTAAAPFRTLAKAHSAAERHSAKRHSATSSRGLTSSLGVFLPDACPGGRALSVLSRTLRRR